MKVDYKITETKDGGWRIFRNGRWCDELWYITKEGAEKEVERLKERDQKIYNFLGENKQMSPLKVEVIYRGDNPGLTQYYYFPISFPDVDRDMVEDYKGWREDIRGHLKEIAIILYGEDNLVGVKFDDECPDCGKTSCNCAELGG